MTKGYPVPPAKKAQLGLHGSTRDIQGAIVPASEHGKGATYPTLSGSEDTYFIPYTGLKEQEEKAWRWSNPPAWNASPDEPDPPFPKRPRVYVTKPVGDQHIDSNIHGQGAPYHEDHWNTNERVAPRQEIVDTHWAPPPADVPEGLEPGLTKPVGVKSTHVSQTLAPVNWNQFGAPNYTVHFETGDVLHDRSEPGWDQKSYLRMNKAGMMSRPAESSTPPIQLKGQTQLPFKETL